MARRQLQDSIEKLESVDDLHLFRKVFDSLSEHVALLDGDGNILATNASWNRFLEQNVGPNVCRVDGSNYITVSESAVGPASEEAHLVAQGLRNVLSGKLTEFKIEYPCHSPTQKRWFLMYASPIMTGEDIEGAVVSHIPITERKLAEEALRESEEKFASAFEYAAIGKALVAPTGKFIKANSALCSLLEYTEEELREKSFMDLTYPEDMASGMELVRQLCNGEIRSFQIEKRCVAKSGRIVWGLLSVSAVWESEGAPRYLIAQFQDIDKRKRLEAELTRLAVTDPLTGAPNRRHYLDRLREELARKKRLQTSLCVAMLDIDDFKQVNDTHGHEAGDKVLQALVAKSLELLREVDVFGRIGGEEFAVVLTPSDAESAAQVAERLRSHLAQLEVPSGAGCIRFTVSIGLHMVGDGETVDEAMKAADIALYAAKMAGKNRVCTR